MIGFVCESSAVSVEVPYPFITSKFDEEEMKNTLSKIKIISSVSGNRKQPISSHI